MKVKLLKVLEDLYEIRAHLEHKRFSTVQRRRVDRVIRAVREMLLANSPSNKPCTGFWNYVRSGINIGLAAKTFSWIESVIKSIIQSE